MTSVIVPGATAAFVSTIFYTPTANPTNLPPLVSHYVPPADCRDRWVLPSPNGPTISVYSTDPSSSDLGDRLYTSCMPLSHIGYFSPGACPEAYTLAYAIAWQWSTSGSLDQEWNGFCCRSGMTIEDYICMSTFSTPLRAFVPITITTSGMTTGTPDVVYQYTDLIEVGDDVSYVTSTNTTTVRTGIAYADPIYVAWKEKDLSIFPLAYATSVAKQFSIPFTPTPQPGISSVLPGETNPPPPPSSGLSTGAKAGIGVGVVVGSVAIVGIGILSLCLRRRRKRRVTVGAPGNELPEMIDESKERQRS